MNINLFLAIFGALSILYLLIGVYTARHVNDTSDYFLAGRQLGFWPVTLTLIATQIGGGMLLGTSQKAYEIGIYGIMYTLGMVLGFILLGAGLAAKWQALQLETTAQLFEVKFYSPLLKKIASLLSIITLCGLLIGQIVASRSFLLGLGVQNELIFLAFWAFIIIYTITGGLRAVVYTDVVQVLVIILVFGGLFIYQLGHSPLALGQVLFSSGTQNFNWQSISWARTLLPTLLMPAAFSLIEQDLAQRFLAARSGKIAITAALTAGAFLLLFACVPIYFGLQTKLLGLTLPAGANPLLTWLSHSTNELIFVLAACAIIAAITSTADSLLCAIGSNLAQDFTVITNDKPGQLAWSKLVTLLAGTFAVGISYLTSQDIINILIESYTISVSCLLVPTLAALFGYRCRPLAAWGAVSLGLASFIICQFWPVPYWELITLLCSGLGYWFGSFLTDCAEILPPSGRG